MSDPAPAPQPVRAAADATPPDLLWSDPTSGETWTSATDTTLWFKFTESVASNPGSGPIVLTTSDGTVVATWDALTPELMASNWAQLTLPASLAADTAYRLELPAGVVTDNSGNAFAARTIDFHTGLPPQAVAAPSFAATNSDQANTSVAGDQVSPLLARMADGSVLAVWSSRSGSTQSTSDDILGQRYDGGGHKIGGEMLLAHGGDAATVAGLADGSFVVTWANGLANPSNGTPDLREQHFDASGQPIGAAQAANTTQEGPNLRLVSTIALADGGSLVMMEQTYNTGVTIENNVFWQRFDASGAKVGAETQLPVGGVFGADVVALAGGGWAVTAATWDSRYGPNIQDMTTMVYDASGNAVRTWTTKGTAWSPALAQLANGHVVLSTGEELGLFDASMSTGGTPVDIAVGFTNRLVPLADGGFLGIGTNGTDNSVLFGQYFDAAGHAAGPMLQLPNGSVQPTPDGGFLVAFAQTNANTGSDIEVEKFAPVAAAPAPATILGTTGDDHLTGTAGNDRLDGISGNDTLDGGAGTDTAVIDTSVAGVQSYSIGAGGITVTTALGTETLVNIERVQFSDALFALDTHPGEHTWEAAALFHAGFGVLPGMEDLSHWTAQADQSASMGELAQHMIDAYAPGVSSSDLVAYLYQQLTHQTATADVVQSYVDQIGPGKTFATQGDLLAYAANLTLNTDGVASIVGTVQQLDPGAF
jgi:hypothetical protein